MEDVTALLGSVLKTARRPLGFRFLIPDTTDAGVQVGIIPSSVAEEEENG